MYLIDFMQNLTNVTTHGKKINILNYKEGSLNPFIPSVSAKIGVSKQVISFTGFGPALTAVWSEAPPLTVRCLSPLPGFESQPGHVRKLPVPGTPVSSTSYNWLVTNKP